MSGPAARPAAVASPSADTNLIVAGLLRDLAVAQTSTQRAWGYKQAANAILALDEPLEALVQPDGTLARIPRIGPSSTRVIQEVLATGASPVVERVIDANVAENLKCRVLAEGANGPTTPDADLVLEKRQSEVFLIPDILCNSGGVVVSYFEWVQDLQQLFWEEEEVTRREYAILDRAFDTMVQRANADKIPHRTAAMAIGVEKVRAAKNTRGLFP